MDTISYTENQKWSIDLVLEAWRFSNVFNSVLAKLPPDDYAQYHGRYSWFRKRLDEILDEAGLRLIDFPSGTQYDVGMAVTPINLDDFATDEPLVIDQTLEPVIMKGSSVIRPGTVTLRRLDS